MDLYLLKKGKYIKATPSQVCEAASAFVFDEANKDRPTLESPKDAEKFLMMQSGLDHEQFGAVFLDTRQRVICVRILWTGTVDNTACHPRELVKACIEEGAAKLLLFHNHPSGVATPSPQDVEMTQDVKQALALFGIALVDHMVIGGEKAASMAERGLL